MTSIDPSIFSPPQPEGRLIGHKAKMRHLLEVYSGRGLTLEEISQPKVLDRSISVLKGYCRDFSISFPDYVPRAMRSKKGDA